jgi:SAM-dependent methyltransferase
MQLVHFVETGTGEGHSLAWAQKHSFGTLQSCETNLEAVERNRERFGSDQRIVVSNQKSTSLIAGIDLPEPTLYFLDAHYAGSPDLGQMSYSDSTMKFHSSENFPLADELELLLAKKHVYQDVIIMDDARIYSDEQFYGGDCPKEAQAPAIERIRLQGILERFNETHERVLLPHEQGYWLLIPRQKKTAINLQEWLNILRIDSSMLQLIPGISGATSISMPRRIRDPRFSNRYFVGAGIDVGGGADCLGLYSELFPQIKNVIAYDQNLGDGQLLSNVPDEEFDFVYSSHCLEHLRDPREALENWIRVTRPSGYLVISIPDEDLYEQGNWPSIFNNDHKMTFTMYKEKSWSPVSHNVFDLISGLKNKVECLSLQLIDEGYRYNLKGNGFDQSGCPLGESSIEFILRKK